MTLIGGALGSRTLTATKKRRPFEAAIYALDVGEREKR
jgi:hypothetical protein